MIAAALGMLLAGAYVPGAQAQQPDLAVAESIRLKPGDLLRITVWPDSGLSGQYQVEDTGLLHLPGLGAMPVAGQPLSTVRADLRRLYGEVYNAPVVTVTPVFFVGILGAVVRPDVYEVRAVDTLLDAISRAGGLRPEAHPREIIVIREGEAPQTASLEDAARGEGLLVTRVRSGDRIIVPERRRVSFQSVVLGLQSIVLLVSLLTR
jgi:polysaccharide biosynthesis/export protein